MACPYILLLEAIGLAIEYYVVGALGIVCYNENINHEEHEDKNHFFISPSCSSW